MPTKREQYVQQKNRIHAGQGLAAFRHWNVKRYRDWFIRIVIGGCDVTAPSPHRHRGSQWRQMRSTASSITFNIQID